MPHIGSEQRQKMEQDGTWGLFKARKTELQTTGGCDPASAHRQALTEFCRPDDGVPGPSREDAVKVTALEGKMGEVNHLFLGYLPDGCGNQRPSDPLGQAWNDTFNAIAEVEQQLEILGEMLRGNAGITWEEAIAAIADAETETVPA